MLPPDHENERGGHSPVRFTVVPPHAFWPPIFLTLRRQWLGRELRLCSYGGIDAPDCALLRCYALTKAQSGSLEAVQKRAIHIICNLTRGMPYSSMVFCANINSLSSREENLYRGYFSDIMDHASCQHSRLPPHRPTAITSRLRSPQTFSRLPVATVPSYNMFSTTISKPTSCFLYVPHVLITG